MPKPSQYLTIIVYHYVRDLENTRYPLIKGLSVKKFKGQLDYLQKHYKLVNTEQVYEFFLYKKPLPSNACLLTFDDGLIDHFINVFPILMERNISGIFFPVAKSVLERYLLDVHKIHFILASVGNSKIPDLLNKIFSLIDEHRRDFNIPSKGELLRKYQKPGNKWDWPEVSFVKGILQYGLSELINNETRQKIINILFNEYVDVPENVLAEELYMNSSQLKTMIKNGMVVGGHSYSHPWLDKLEEKPLKQEIEKSIIFLKKIYSFLPSHLFFSFPYNDRNNLLLNVLKKYGYRIGLTTDVGLATLENNPLLLPRLAPNHFPFSKEEEKCEWTKKILEE